MPLNNVVFITIEPFSPKPAMTAIDGVDWQLLLA